MDWNRWVETLLPSAILLTLTFSTAVYVVTASFSVESSVGDGVYVVVRLENLNSTVYAHLTDPATFNSTTIPERIIQGCRRRGLERVFFYGERVRYDPVTASVEVSFYLTGLDILRFRFDEKTMLKIYRLDMGWRKVVCNITGQAGERVLTLNLAKYFGRPLEEWNRTEHLDPEKRTRIAFVCNYAGETGFDPTFKVVLPPEAGDIQRSGDWVTFTVPAGPVESAILNPLTVLGIIVVIDISIIVSREAKGKTKVSS